MNFEEKLHHMHMKAHKAAFMWYLRKGYVPASLCQIMGATASVKEFMKFNPYHDPDNGQFTFAPGGAGGGGEGDSPVGQAPAVAPAAAPRAQPVDAVLAPITVVGETVTSPAQVIPISSRDQPAKPVVSRHPPKSLKPSVKVIEYIKGKEEFIPRVYPDVARHNTIGFGHKIKPGESFPNGITREEALRLFHEDLGQAVDAVQRYVTAPLAQYEFDALTSLVYNVGADAFRRSNMRKLLNAEKYPEAANEFLDWNKIWNQETRKLEPNDGLTIRRHDERNMFLGKS